MTAMTAIPLVTFALPTIRNFPFLVHSCRQHMSPVTHLLAGWMLASAAPSLSRREKAAVVLAGIAPDIDGLGIIPELLTRPGSATAGALAHLGVSHPLLWFSEYHHSLHTLAFAVAVTIAAWLISTGQDFASGPAMRPRPQPIHPGTTAALAFLSFHLHLFCDLIGSRGPDGYAWPIPYLRPFSNSLQFTWSGEWALNGWQNFTITFLLLLATFWIAWAYASSPLELLSEKANQALVRTLRSRFPSRTIPT